TARLLLPSRCHNSSRSREHMDKDRLALDALAVHVQNAELAAGTRAGLQIVRLNPVILDVLLVEIVAGFHLQNGGKEVPGAGLAPHEMDLAVVDRGRPCRECIAGYPRQKGAEEMRELSGVCLPA